MDFCFQTYQNYNKYRILPTRPAYGYPFAKQQLKRTTIDGVTDNYSSFPQLLESKDICCYGYNLWKDGDATPPYDPESTITATRAPYLVGTDASSSSWGIDMMHNACHLKGLSRAGDSYGQMHWMLTNDGATEKIKAYNYNLYDGWVCRLTCGTSGAGSNFQGTDFTVLAMNSRLSTYSGNQVIVPPLVNVWVMLECTQNITPRYITFLRSAQSTSYSYATAPSLKADSGSHSCATSHHLQWGGDNYKNCNHIQAPVYSREKIVTGTSAGTDIWALRTHITAANDWAVNFSSQGAMVISRPIIGFTVSNTSQWRIKCYQYGIELKSQT